MGITPEWVAVVLTLMTMSAGAGVWIERRFVAARHALPIVRQEWTSGPAGHAGTVTLVNRLDEDLYVERVEAKTMLLTKEPGTSKAQAVLEPTSRTLPLSWRIPAKGAEAMVFRLAGADSPRWLRLTISSSARTLRSRRLTVIANQTP